MKKQIIKSKKLYSENSGFQEGCLWVVGERFVTEEEYHKAECPEEIIDVGDSYVIPGLTDIHFHGCVGHDCCDGTQEAFRAIAEYEASCGVTAITPATMTMPEEVLFQIVRTAAEYSSTGGADLCGLYMEGPFISVDKKGAQNESYIQKPDISLFQKLQKAASGKIRTVVVAPETEGAMEFIQGLSGQVTLSLAHSAADYETASNAFDLGMNQVTHLYNAMMPFTHRQPGPVGAAADHTGVMVELICDGVHIHPSVVRNTFRMFGDERIIFISDSMRATGMPDGEYELGGQKVYVRGHRAVLEDGTLAGSVTNLMDCMRRAVTEMGIPLESAVKCAAVNPTKAIGMFQEFGSLTPGKYANVVVLDEKFQVEMVQVKGAKLK